MIVIASIHQPSTSTLLLFDNVLLLSQGKTMYYGPPSHSTAYFSSLGYATDAMMSPAENMLELTNIDFMRDGDPDARLQRMSHEWEKSSERKSLIDSIAIGELNGDTATIARQLPNGYPRNFAMQTWIQLHRMALVRSVYIYVANGRNLIVIHWLMVFVSSCT
jgi:ABC-type multidrug transport system ATPase subunit